MGRGRKVRTLLLLGSEDGGVTTMYVGCMCGVVFSLKEVVLLGR